MTVTIDYHYLSIFPISLPNVIWVLLSLILLVAYISLYHVKSSNFLGNLLRYVLEYGKYKTYHVSTDLPKRYFIHYYYFASFWNSLCLVTVIGLCFQITASNWIAEIFLLQTSANLQGDQLSIIVVMTMLTLQSYRRLYECLFVSVFSNTSKINLIQYIWGLVFYASLAPTLISECLPLHELPFGKFELRHAVGIVGFIVASYVHHQSHVILGNMRKTNHVKHDSHGIPVGGMFKYVSCPHYFAEILIYLSFLIIVHSQCVSWWLVFVYNFVVHVSMAAGSHTWYKKTFPSYPKTRKSVIPFVL